MAERTQRVRGRGEKERGAVGRTGLDGVALKPLECDLRRAAAIETDRFVIDYEGRGPFPEESVLRELLGNGAVRVTTPVRAAEFDPLEDEATATAIPDGAQRILVAGNGAYLDEAERRLAVAPRLAAARESMPEAWVGTEGIERIALAAGGTQFELLSRHTDRAVRALRAAGFEGRVALYAPVVLSDDADEILDAVGGYAARRRPVANALSGENRTDRTVAGRDRSILESASREYALVGSPETVRGRIAELKNAGIDLVVGYPARGIDEFLD